jgi:Tol biopolymer transport system component
VSEGQTRLFVRSLDAIEARPLAGTEGAQYPFWSPDSRSIGFFAENKLKRVEAAGGPPLTLCGAPDGKGGSWSPRGVIVFAPDSASALQRVPQGGGAPTAVTRLDTTSRKDDSHRHPRFLPDGHHFLYLARTAGGGVRGDNAVMVGSLDGGADKLILRSPAAAEYAAGRLLFLRERTLMAQPFDAKRLELTGDAVPLADDVGLVDVETAQAVLAASADVLVYRQGRGGLDRKLVWRDRAGRALSTLGDVGHYLFQVALSPRADAAAVTVQDSSSGTTDVWTYDVARGVRSRFSFDPRSDTEPIFSRDGQSIVFSSARDAQPGLYRKRLGGAGAEELLLESKTSIVATDFSPDGRVLTFSELAEKANWDIWTLPLEGERKPIAQLQTPHLECCSVFSPDGRFLAYVSDESGEYEIYAMPYPATGRKWQISSHGGFWPHWRSDGREILYQAPDGTVTAAEVAEVGPTLSVGAVKPLFKTRVGAGTEYVLWPTADAQRFLVVEPVESEVSRPLTVVLGWQALLSR